MENALLILIAWMLGRLPRVLTHSEVLDLCAKVGTEPTITPGMKPDWVRLLEGTRKPAFLSSARDLARMDFDFDVSEALRMEFGDD